MDRTSKQTALFFGFLTAAMTYTAAQAAPVHPPQAQASAAIHQTAGERMLATMETGRHGPIVRRGAARTGGD